MIVWGKLVIVVHGLASEKRDCAVQCLWSLPFVRGFCLDSACESLLHPYLSDSPVSHAVHDPFNASTLSSTVNRAPLTEVLIEIFWYLLNYSPHRSRRRVPRLTPSLPRPTIAASTSHHPRKVLDHSVHRLKNFNSQFSDD